jgi:hypothetical protein
MDIGTDEGFYMVLVKNFYDFKSAITSNQLLIYPFYLLREFIPFTIYSPRVVNFIYSLLLISSGLFFIRKINGSFSVASLVFIAVLTTNASYVFVGSSAFAEIPATIALFFGFYFWSQVEKGTKYLLFSFVLFALAGVTKFQIMPILLLTLIIVALLDNKLKYRSFLSLLFVIFLWAFGTTLFYFSMGGTLRGILSMYFTLSGSISQVASSTDLTYRFSKINGFNTLLNICIYAPVLIYYLNKFRRYSLFEKILFIFFILNLSWWIFSFFSITPRNLIYAIYIGMLLFSIVTARYINRIMKDDYSIFYKIALPVIILLTLNIIAFVNVEASRKISDETLFALNGQREPFGDGSKRIYSGQSEFYTYINNSIPDTAKIYWISMPYNNLLFTSKSICNISIDSVISNTLPSGSYFLLSYIDYKNCYVSDSLYCFLNHHSKIVFKKNYWEIYKLVD